MEEPKKTKKKFNLRLAIGIVAFLCCLLVIAGLNEPHFPPFNANVELKAPTSLAVSDDGGVIVDSENKRMLILSEPNKVSAIVETTASGSPIDKVESVTMSGGYIYAIGTTHYNQGTYLSSESVVKYDLKGNCVETLTTRNYGEDEFVNNNTFKSIVGFDGAIYLTCSEGKEVSVTRLKETEELLGTWTLPEYVFSAAYNPDKNKLYVLGMSKTGYSIECDSGQTVKMTYPELIAAFISDSGLDPSKVDVEKWAEYNCIPAVVYNEDGKAGYLMFSNNLSGDVVAFDSNGEVLNYFTECTYSASVFIFNLLFYIALTLLACGAVVALVWLFIKKFTARSRIVAVIIGGIILTAVFYTIQIRAATENEVKSNLITQTKQNSFVMTSMVGDAIAERREEGIQEYCSDPENQETIQEIHNALKTMCDANGIDRSCLIIFGVFDKDGQPYSFVDSRNHYLPGQPMIILEDAQKVLDGIGEGEVITSESSYETLLYCYEYIYSSQGEIIGFISVAAYRGNLSYIQSQSALNLAIILVALFIGIFVTFSAIKTFKNDFKRRRGRDKTDINGKTVDMAGFMRFITCLVSSLDSVIIVYVSQSLCVDVDPLKQATLVALPLAAVSAGQLIGTLVAEPLIRKRGERFVAIVSSVMTIASMMFCMFAVGRVSILAYILGKLVMGTFLGGITFVQIDTMPFKTQDENARKSAMNSVIQSSAAASIISMLLSGFISEFLSYSIVYLVGAVMSVFVLIMSIMVFKNTSDQKGKAVKKEKMSDSIKYWTVFFKKTMLMFIIFYIVPAMLVNGYKSYLFPLYSSGAGISALLLSNISVFVKAFTYITNDPLRKLSEKFNPKVMLVVPRFIACFGLICFLISPNIYWAIVMLFVVDITNRMTSIGTKIYMAEISEAQNLNTKRVQSNYYTVSSAIYVLQSPILSSIVNVGMNFACSIVGVIAGAMFAVFAIFSNIKPKKRGELGGPEQMPAEEGSS